MGSAPTTTKVYGGRCWVGDAFHQIQSLAAGFIPPSPKSRRLPMFLPRTSNFQARVRNGPGIFCCKYVTISGFLATKSDWGCKVVPKSDYKSTITEAFSRMDLREKENENQ